MTPVYRRATSDDVPELAQLRWDFRQEGGETPIQSREEFTRRYRGFFEAGVRYGSWAHWVAEVDAQIVAHMAVQVIGSVPRPSRASDQWGYLTDCYTRPEFRDDGIGSSLLKQVIAWAEKNDLEILLVFPGEGSVSFYEKAGFGPDETLQLRLREWDA